MRNRFLLALGMVIASAGVTAAQAPPAEPPTQSAPTMSSEPVPQAPMINPDPATGSIFGDTIGFPLVQPQDSSFWAKAEYLLAWFSGDRLPPLVTTSVAGTPASSAAVLGQTITSTVFGGDKVNVDARSGGRFETGYWFTPDRFLGIEAGFMVLESQATPFSASSTNTPILARPFTDQATLTPQAQLIAYPGQSTGAIDILMRSDNFYETHVDFCEQVFNRGPVALTALFGYRYFRYTENLGIQQQISPEGASFVPGTSITSQDNFSTQNTFNGLDFGLRGQYQWQNLSVGLLGKLAVGQVNHVVNISGSQQVAVPGSPTLVEAGGLYALASNIGRMSNNEWTTLPELGLNLGWQANRNVRFTMGYTAMWINDIARAADQIDQTVNRNLIPPATATPQQGDNPAFIFMRSDVMIQAITFGMLVSY